MSISTEKKNIYANFGPEESYFIRCGPRHRSYGKINGKKVVNWNADGYVKFDCVTWKSDFYFACRHKQDRINQNKTQNPNPSFKEWMDKRARCPLRLVVGEGSGSWFAWMPHGDYLAGPNAPGGMIQEAEDKRKMYTSIRCAAIGANGTWLIIWDDGTMVYNLSDKYPKFLDNLGSLERDDVSWVALNAFRAGDYFLYVERTRTAYFQVSEAFGKDLEQVLVEEGIKLTDIVHRKQEVADPKKIFDLARNADWPKTAAKTANVDVKLVDAALNVARAGAILYKYGHAIAGAAACNVM